jgi:16S rRNA (guanine527-N7)-methyltransferase
MRKVLIDALNKNQAAFGLDLHSEVSERLAEYHALVTANNDLLHLVAPCAPEVFATRHLLESLTMLGHLPRGARFTDVGSGGGLPALPCLIARGDLSGVLVEAKEKKAGFLKFVVAELGLADRVKIVARQFHEIDPDDSDTITCRALDKFSEKLPRLLKWAGKRRLLLFGGENLAETLRRQSVGFDRELTPLSERRYLYVSK